MRIKAQQLAPYLPYGLKARFRETDKPNCKKYVIGTIGAMYCEKNGDISITCYDTVNAAPTKFMPILRPLEDLYREDLPFNKKILDSFNNEYDFEVFEAFCLSEMRCTNCREYLIYETAELLIKNHYDIFRLIEQGLAFDVNDLK